MTTRPSALSDAGQVSTSPRGLQSAPEAKRETRDWLSVPERGTLFGILAVVWTAVTLGRPAVRVLVSLVALYYVLRDSRVRAASRGWWLAVEGSPPSFSKIYGHVRRFANVTADRLFLLTDRTRSFVMTRDGNEYLKELESSRRGAILLGAHLGSFEAMRLGGIEDQLSINVVGNFRNARMINQLLDRMSDHNSARLIEAVPGDVGFVFDIQERLHAGEMVAILGDRVAKNQPSVTVEFFGRPARFPTGPFQLAAILKCPIYLTFGIFREPNLYELSCRPFAQRIELPRRNREAALRKYVQEYARALEEKARSAPDNWFNFYEFWEEPEA